MRIVLTGFDSFSGVETNPSQLIVEHFARRPEGRLVAEVLPTQYAGAAQRIRTLRFSGLTGEVRRWEATP